MKKCKQVNWMESWEQTHLHWLGKQLQMLNSKQKSFKSKSRLLGFSDSVYNTIKLHYRILELNFDSWWKQKLFLNAYKIK